MKQKDIISGRTSGGDRAVYMRQTLLLLGNLSNWRLSPIMVRAAEAEDCQKWCVWRSARLCGCPKCNICNMRFLLRPFCGPAPLYMCASCKGCLHGHLGLKPSRSRGSWSRFDHWNRYGSLCCFDSKQYVRKMTQCKHQSQIR